MTLHRLLQALQGGGDLVTGPTLQHFQTVWNGLWGKFVNRSKKDENEPK